MTQTAGEAAAQTIVFSTVEAKDWVKASLADLVPVSAGRYVVHGSHDRERVPANKIGIEIEAALAFGTGHHGTTRGCLMLLDQVLQPTHAQARARSGIRHRRAGDCRRQDIAPACSGQRHRSAVGTRGARERKTQRRGQSGRNRSSATGFHSPAVCARAPFGLVLANILANPLRQLAPHMATHLAPERS